MGIGLESHLEEIVNNTNNTNNRENKINNNNEISF